MRIDDLDFVLFVMLAYFSRQISHSTYNLESLGSLFLHSWDQARICRNPNVPLCGAEARHNRKFLSLCRQVYRSNM